MALLASQNSWGFPLASLNQEKPMVSTVFHPNIQDLSFPLSKRIVNYTLGLSRFHTALLLVCASSPDVPLIPATIVHFHDGTIFEVSPCLHIPPTLGQVIYLASTGAVISKN